MVSGKLGAASDELKSAALLSRLVGGFVADDEEWLKASEAMHAVSGAVPEPIVRLRPALQEAGVDLCIDASVAASAGWATPALSIVDGTKNPRSKWAVREGRLFKCDGKAVALFGTEDAAKSAADKKEKYAKRVKEHRAAAKELGADASEARRARAKRKIAAAVAKASAHRGAPLTPEGLARRVASFV